MAATDAAHAGMLEEMMATQATAAASVAAVATADNVGASVDDVTPIAYDTTTTAYTANASWSMRRNEKYENYLCHFMGYVHQKGGRYSKGTTFTREQLLQIRPQHLLDWLSMKAFGKTNYSIEGGDRPMSARSSTLEQNKKGVSFFMIHPDNNWMNGQGNPTKHNSLRKIIDDVKLCEVRGEGSPSNAKRAMTLEEFKKELEMLREHGKINGNDYNFCVKYPAMALWQYHLIGRVDDVCNFGMANPKGHGTFNFAAKTKVQWSKNVRDEQDCPDQILLGSEDP